MSIIHPLPYGISNKNSARRRSTTESESTYSPFRNTGKTGKTGKAARLLQCHYLPPRNLRQHLRQQFRQHSGNISGNTALLLAPHPSPPYPPCRPTKKTKYRQKRQQSQPYHPPRNLRQYLRQRFRQHSGNISGNTLLSRNTSRLPPAPNFSAPTSTCLPTGNISGNISGKVPAMPHSCSPLIPRRYTHRAASPKRKIPAKTAIRIPARSRQYLRQHLLPPA